MQTLTSSSSLSLISILSFSRFISKKRMEEIVFASFRMPLRLICFSFISQQQNQWRFEVDRRRKREREKVSMSEALSFLERHPPSRFGGFVSRTMRASNP